MTKWVELKAPMRYENDDVYGIEMADGRIIYLSKEHCQLIELIAGSLIHLRINRSYARGRGLFESMTLQQERLSDPPILKP